MAVYFYDVNGQDGDSLQRKRQLGRRNMNDERLRTSFMFSGRAVFGEEVNGTPTAARKSRDYMKT